METINCNLCGAKNTVPVFTLTDFLLERENIQATFVRCDACGLVYQNPRPSQDEMSAHYPPEYESYNTDLSNKSVPWFVRKIYTYGIYKRSRIATRDQKSGKLLDVGCATGTFLKYMQEQSDWDVSGVELNPHAAQIAKKQGLNVYNGTLENAKFPSNSFDVITLWDVLEHLYDPTSSLREIRRILKPGGTLIIRVPNLDSRDAKWFGTTWAGWDAPRHLYVFTPDTLTQLVETTGLQTKTIKCNIGGYPTFVLSVRFWLSAQKVNPSTRKKITKALYHPLSRILSAPIFFLLGLRLKGPLITLTAEKV